MVWMSYDLNVWKSWHVRYCAIHMISGKVGEIVLKF
jgi:hypothetical protein